MSLPHDDGSFACGYLEGFLTAQQISDHYLSWYDSQFGGSPEVSPPSFSSRRRWDVQSVWLAL